jgi:hypothetical protein
MTNLFVQIWPAAAVDVGFGQKFSHICNFILAQMWYNKTIERG